MELEEYVRRNPAQKRGEQCAMCKLKLLFPRVIAKAESRPDLNRKQLLGWIRNETKAEIGIHSLGRHLRDNHKKLPVGR